MLELYEPGSIVAGASSRYTVVRELAQGAFAHSYEAVDDSGEKCLLKGYLDPIPEPRFCAWFPKYRALQQEIQKRLRNIPHQAIQTVDEFIFKDAYHIAVEWAEGTSLETLYGRELQADETLEKPLLVAKVMMFTLSKIHEQAIIHCDQKLANFFAQEEPSITARYRIKIADFDMSLLADRPSPKPGDRALAGTQGYFSPEHLRSERPQFGSDVFTVGGIMLFELLAGQHPFEAAARNATTEAEQNSLILKAVEKKRVPRLSDVVPRRAVRINRQTEEINHACFAPRHEDRPSGAEIHKILLGHPMPRRLVLIGGPARLKWRLEQSATLSRRMCEALFQADSNTISSNQAGLEPNEDRTEWYVIPRNNVVNKTMLDGKEVTERTALVSGMKLQIGNPKNGHIGFEMEVAFENL